MHWHVLHHTANNNEEQHGGGRLMLVLNVNRSGETGRGARIRMSQVMQTCIHECPPCYPTCLEMAMTYLIESGGEHVEPNQCVETHNPTSKN